VPNLGRSDTLAVIRAQGMQSIPNVTDITVTSFTADVPSDKNVELTWDDGDFAVQSCVKWARVTVAEPMSVVLRSVPADDAAELDIYNSATPALRIQVYSLSGHIVREHNVTLEASSTRVRIPTADLAAGVYVVVAEDGVGQRQARSVVVH
jgi:hypothetical protein